MQIQEFNYSKSIHWLFTIFNMSSQEYEKHILCTLFMSASTIKERVNIPQTKLSQTIINCNMM